MARFVSLIFIPGSACSISPPTFSHTRLVGLGLSTSCLLISPAHSSSANPPPHPHSTTDASSPLQLPRTVYHERRFLESHGACCCESSASSPTSCLYLDEQWGRRFAQGQVNNHDGEVEAAAERRGRERLYADWSADLLLFVVVVVVLWVKDPDLVHCGRSTAKKI